MSKTRARIYSQGYRAGRRATRWERLKWFFCHRRAKVKVEDWLVDEGTGDTDFMIALFAAVAIGLAVVAMVFAARLG